MINHLSRNIFKGNIKKLPKLIYITIASKKILLWLSVVATALGHWQCSESLEGFDMSYRKDLPREIPASASTLFSHNFSIENITSNAEAIYTQQNVTGDDVLRIIPRSARISAKFDDADLSFLSRVFVYVYPVGEPNKKIEVFYRDDVPFKVGTFLNLNSGIANIKSIVGGENYSVEVRLDLRSQPGRNIETQLDFGFYAVTKE